MDDSWAVAQASSPQPSHDPPTPAATPPAPRYTQTFLRGFPPRPHFRMVEEPDSSAAASNSNGWVVSEDGELGEAGLWSQGMFKRWVETTTTVGTPTQINEAVHGRSNEITAVKCLRRPGDEESAYHGEEFIPKDTHHFDCDADTMTGDLLPPVKQPRSLPAQLHPLETFEPDRKERSSNDIIMGKVSGQVGTKSARKSTPQKAYQEAILAVEEEDLRRKPMKPMVGHLYPIPKNLTLRPVVHADTSAIADIYNAEVMGAGMAPDSTPVLAGQHLQILDTCQANSKPFVVAVKGGDLLADPTNWPDKSAYDDWVRWKKAQGESVDGGKEEVVGFAFLCPFDYGIWASEGNARYAAKIRCFVGPEHRRQGVGRALVDLMLQMTITGYTSRCESAWKNHRTSKVFNTKAFENEKKYHRVFIEVYFKGRNKGDSNFEGIQKLLENQFGFTPMGHILGAYKTDRGEESVWLDKLIWGMDAVHSDELGWYKDDARVGLNGVGTGRGVEAKKWVGGMERARAEEERVWVRGRGMVKMEEGGEGRHGEKAEEDEELRKWVRGRR